MALSRADIEHREKIIDFAACAITIGLLIAGYFLKPEGIKPPRANSNEFPPDCAIIANLTMWLSYGIAYTGSRIYDSCRQVMFQPKSDDHDALTVQPNNKANTPIP